MKASDSIPRLADGRVDVETWSARLDGDFDADREVVIRAITLLTALPHRVEEFLEKGVELANLVLTLNMDAASVAAALLYRPVRTGSLEPERISASVSSEVAELVVAVVRLADSSLLDMNNSPMQTSESRNQVDNIRRMLISMVDDARVAVLKLAERTVALRGAKHSTPERQARIAQEAHQVFAPLANRLGVWQLKWELEDLALRYLAPDVYKTIARQLDGRREEREREIRDIIETVETRLAEKGIQAKVSGRAKHIYSIWRKMRAKQVGMKEVYDVRAIRVLVPDIGQCYSALGVIHTQWQHLPSEFDDYVAVPKENGYRSIHTAVSWSDGKTLEVQIRTPEMHEEAELGVCAHWAYKDGPSEDDFYARKMDWLRQVVEWQEETRSRVSKDRFGLELGSRAREERIFVYTPKGHVLDLTTGATALDFAYRVHTEVGHRCIGALVDGKQAALNQPLLSGQRVEILTGEEIRPRRIWLHQHLDCLRSSRARDKVSEWFRNRLPEENEAEGLALLNRSAARLDLPIPDSAHLDVLAAGLGYDGAKRFLEALGDGSCQILDVLGELVPADRAGFTRSLPPEQMSLLDGIVSRRPSEAQQSFTIELRSDDRSGLLMDITTFLDRRGIMLLSNSGRVLPDRSTVLIEVEVHLEGLLELFCLMDALEMIPAVREARCIRR
ncbi:MAG: bifunctional (p)ppGpp synthetase/guanosine-3',5'-bis(diphosphate) 3'-pyrophosphohydrolase [Pseudomonadales bacterium]